MKKDYVGSALGVVEMLIEQRRDLLAEMLANGKYEDLVKIKVLQDAIDATVRAHASERESRIDNQIKISRLPQPFKVDPTLPFSSTCYHR